MHNRTFLALITFLCLVASPTGRTADATKSNDQRVRDYVAAFNKKDVETMLSMVTEDIQWLNVAGDKISVETQGKAKLRESMTGYFKSTPTAKSELEWVQATSVRVAALERASWQTKSGPKSQKSLSVYEFRGELICRVYYYPAEK
jgi:ketosteroid isomerase-like protein